MRIRARQIQTYALCGIFKLTIFKNGWYVDRALAKDRVQCQAEVGRICGLETRTTSLANGNGLSFFGVGLGSHDWPPQRADLPQTLKMLYLIVVGVAFWAGLLRIFKHKEEELSVCYEMAFDRRGEDETAIMVEVDEDEALIARHEDDDEHPSEHSLPMVQNGDDRDPLRDTLLARSYQNSGNAGCYSVSVFDTR